MKKIISLLIITIISIACSTSSEENNSTSALPLSPSSLTGIVISSTQVNLSWIDNSDNENGFKIERKIDAGNFEIIGNTISTNFSDIGLTSNKYTYRVCSFNKNGNSATYTNEITLSILSLPTISTIIATGITSNSAISGGIITADGGSPITARGVVWSTTPNPMITLITKTSDGIGIGSYMSNITNLLPVTSYYARAYATNNTGTSYGDVFVFKTTATYSIGKGVTDIEGNFYPSIIIKGQEWMQKNLNVTKYRNGDLIQQVSDPAQWGGILTGIWSYYENNSANGTLYGKLYNWFAVKDSRGLAPQGWHIPTDAEWKTLYNNIGGWQNAGGKMTEMGTLHWPSPNSNATNESGFTALPGGAIIHNDFTNQYYYINSISAHWWCLEGNGYAINNCSPN